jgi:hypothetical protein
MLIFSSSFCSFNLRVSSSALCADTLPTGRFGTGTALRWWADWAAANLPLASSFLRLLLPWFLPDSPRSVDTTEGLVEATGDSAEMRDEMSPPISEPYLRLDPPRDEGSALALGSRLL